MIWVNGSSFSEASLLPLLSLLVPVALAVRQKRPDRKPSRRSSERSELGFVVVTTVVGVLAVMFIFSRREPSESLARAGAERSTASGQAGSGPRPLPPGDATWSRAVDDMTALCPQWQSLLPEGPLRADLVWMISSAECVSAVCDFLEDVPASKRVRLRHVCEVYIPSEAVSLSSLTELYRAECPAVHATWSQQATSASHLTNLFWDLRQCFKRRCEPEDGGLGSQRECAMAMLFAEGYGATGEKERVMGRVLAAGAAELDALPEAEREARTRQEAERQVKQLLYPCEQGVPDACEVLDYFCTSTVPPPKECEARARQRKR